MLEAPKTNIPTGCCAAVVVVVVVGAAVVGAAVVVVGAAVVVVGAAVVVVGAAVVGAGASRWLLLAALSVVSVDALRFLEASALVWGIEVLGIEEAVGVE